MAEAIYDDIKAITIALLSESCGDDYAKYIVDEIINEVVGDIKVATTLEDCTTYDVRSAIGRTILKRLGISI